MQSDGDVGAISLQVKGFKGLPFLVLERTQPRICRAELALSKAGERENGKLQEDSPNRVKK